MEIKNTIVRNIFNVTDLFSLIVIIYVRIFKVAMRMKK